MKTLSVFTIKFKLIIPPLITSLFLVALLIFVSFNVKKQENELTDFFKNRFGNYQVSTGLIQTLQEVHGSLFKIILWGNSGGYEKRIKTLRAKIITDIDRVDKEFQKILESDTSDVKGVKGEKEEKGKKLYGEAYKYFAGYTEGGITKEGYKTIVSYVLEDLGEDGSGAVYAVFYMDTAEDKARALMAKLDEIKKLETTLSTNAYTSALADSENIKKSIIYVFLITLFISVFTALLLSMSIIKPIRLLKSFLIDIHKGEGDLTGQIRITSKDEIGELGFYFNTFIDKLQDIVSQIKDISVRSKDIGIKLSRYSEDTSTSTNEITATIFSLKDNIDHLNQKIQDFPVEIGHIAQSVKSLLQIVGKHKNVINNMSSAVSGMEDSILAINRITGEKKTLSDNLSTTASAGLNKMKNLIDSMGNITRSTRNMLDMVKVIDGIASKINLLAMNAAIEAAHAGETGKGFNVVSSEIRKLAEQTARNSKSIGAELTRIVNDIETTNSITDAAEDAFSTIAKGVENIASSMEEMNTGMQELSLSGASIVENVKDITHITSKIQHEADSVTHSISSIDNSISNVTDHSSNINQGIHEISMGATLVNDKLIELLEIGKENETNIVEIDTNLNQFKTR